MNKTLKILFQMSLPWIPLFVLMLVPPTHANLLITGVLHGLLLPYAIFMLDSDSFLFMAVDETASLPRILLTLLLVGVGVLLWTWFLYPFIFAVFEGWTERGFFAMGNLLGVALLLPVVYFRRVSNS